MTDVPVRVDRTRCVGSGTCTEIAPDLFVLDGGTARVLAPGEPGARVVRDDDATADDVDEAVDSCPVQAIEGGRG
ncbi:ferredoxin [Modestobacter sp. URMC 112]